MVRKDIPARYTGGPATYFKNGSPVATNLPAVTPQNFSAIQAKAALLPYKPLLNEQGEILPGQEELEGTTCLEAFATRNARRASYGDADAGDRMYDRLIGKPTQQVQSVSMTLSYQDWVTKEAKPPTEEELAEAGYTLADITDISEDEDDLAGL